MTLQPLHNRVAIEPRKNQDEVVNGILIPAQQLGEGVLKGVVIAAGPDTSLKTGDTVAFGRYGFDEMKDGSRTLYLMPDELVLAVIVEDAIAA